MALSGGGHRATLFTLGALMYVVESGRARDTSSIASVSGGSITNGFVAQSLNFQSATREGFERDVVKPLASQIALRGTLFDPLMTKLYLLLLGLGLPAAFLPLWLLDQRLLARALVVLALLLVWGWLAGQRGWICAQAFRSTMFSPGGKVTSLENISGSVNHVLCSTEVRSSQSFYFAKEFVYTFALGPGVPGGMPLYQAVQASAAFPGGFPPARLPAGRHQFEGSRGRGEPKRAPRDLILTDGGVYDNMADQWARGFRSRSALWSRLARMREPPGQLVVVNSSARIPWSPFKRGRIPLLGEVLAFLRISNIMYINTTNVRRQDIVSSFDPVAPEQCGELPGVLLQISQSPFDVPSSFARVLDPIVKRRAREALTALGEGRREEWARIARENSAVATTLGKLGPEVSARLLYHGYVTAMCNLYVVFGDGADELGGWSLLPVPPLSRFASLVA